MQKNSTLSFPLLFAKENETLQIKELRGGKNFKDKCICQNIIPGQTIKIVHKSQVGPCIIKVNNSSIILGHGMLNKIFVQPK